MLCELEIRTVNSYLLVNWGYDLLLGASQKNISGEKFPELIEAIFLCII